MFNMRIPTIAIIDSGIGGVSVIRQLIAKFKAGNYIYFADNLYMPYGNKSKSFIRKRIDKIINVLKNKYNVNYIVIACNTASTCVDQNEYKNVRTMQFNKNHTFFATERTKLNMPTLKVIADKTLAKEIEKNIFNKTKLFETVKKCVTKYQLENQNELVLGCTHYELVKELFENLCPNTKFINNSLYILNNIKFEFSNKDLNIVVLTSKKNRELENKIYKLIYS